MNRKVYVGAVLFALVISLALGSAMLEKKAAVQAAGVQAPMFEVDPMWPKPLPNHWVIGMTIGVSVDAADNVWIIHRGGSLEAKESYGDWNPPGADCCKVAPPVLEFDKAGTLIGHWGAYGHKPDDTDPGLYNPDAPIDQQFRSPVHCAQLADDGLLYVCDRVNDRIQVFKPDGTFVKEQIIEKRTLGDGSVWDIAFSKDPEQKFIYLSDGANEKVHILLRETLQTLTSFGDGGRQPGQFYAVHSIATDSKGNIYTTETYRGQRLQKFVYKGLGPVTKEEQGVLWPKK